MDGATGKWRTGKAGAKAQQQGMGTNALNQRLSRIFKDQGIYDQSNSRRTSIRSHSLNTALPADWHWLLWGVLPHWKSTGNSLNTNLVFILTKYQVLTVTIFNTSFSFRNKTPLRWVKKKITLFHFGDVETRPLRNSLKAWAPSTAIWHKNLLCAQAWVEQILKMLPQQIHS